MFTLKEVIDVMRQDGTCNTPSDFPFEIGKQYLFRTIGYHWLGEVISIRGKFLVLDSASWVADTGRYSDALTMH